MPSSLWLIQEVGATTHSEAPPRTEAQQEETPTEAAEAEVEAEERCWRRT